MDKLEIYRQVARLHIENIDQGFLATLGEPFVALMYSAIDQCHDSVLLVEEVDGKVIGFVSGGCGMGAIYRQMMRSPFKLTAALLPSLLRPARAIRIIDILRYSRGAESVKGVPGAELLSLAVAPAWRGKGTAVSLYQRLADHFRARHESAFKITVGNALAPAHRFYRRMGAVAAGQVQVHEGESSTVYIHRL